MTALTANHKALTANHKALTANHKALIAQPPGADGATVRRGWRNH
jgi:hypothetical protein